MSRQIIKKKQLPVAQIKQLLAQLNNYLPPWLRSPTLLVTFILNTLNDITILFCYLILLGQTARLLVTERSYANTKVLMTKWIIFLFFELIFCHVSKESIEGSLLKCIFLWSVLGLVYPSKKYFKGQQLLKESSPMTDSFVINNNSLMEKFLLVILINWLKVIKYVMTFINPSHRKSIEDEVKQINLILGNEKYFFKGENASNQGKGRQKNEFKQPIKEMARQAVSHNTISQAPVKLQMNPPQLSQESGMDFQQMIQKQLTKGIMQVMDMQKANVNEVSIIQQTNNKTDFQNTTFTATKNQQNTLSQSTPAHVQTPIQTSLNQSSVLSKQKKYKKYSVSEYLPLFSTTNRSSAYPNLPNKRCTYYREIQISYDINSAVMTVTSLEDMKVSYHSLEEIVLLEELMIQFEFEQNQQMMVKFRNRNEYEEFISSIDMYQSSLHNK